MCCCYPFRSAPELNQTVTVQPDGYINLQNAAQPSCAGPDGSRAGGRAQKAYAGTLHDPIVNVDLKDFQKPFFTVSGQVGKPGQYELRADITIAEALAVAGGMAPRRRRKSSSFTAPRTIGLR